MRKVIFIEIGIVLSLIIAYGIIHYQHTNENKIIKTNNPRMATIINSENKAVFEINPGNPVSCGTFCREITATITNTGGHTANNVYVGLNISNNIGENIYSTREFLGDVSSKQSKSRTLDINVDCGFLYSKCVGHTPFAMKVEATWDGGNQVFPVEQISG